MVEPLIPAGLEAGNPPLGRLVKLTGVARNKERAPQVTPHAAKGLAAFLAAIAERPAGVFSCAVPPEHTDGFSGVTVTLEIM